MNQKPPQDYSLEKLSKTDGFKIYPPVNADFKFQTLDADTLPDLPNYVDDNDYDPHPNPSGLHMFPGDFDNDPNTPMDTIIKDKRTRKYSINGSPKKKKKRKSYNFDLPTEKELKRFSNPNMYGIPQPYHGKSQIVIFPQSIKETSHLRTPDEGIPQPLNKDIRLGKFKGEIDDDVTFPDSIITNNSLIPNFSRFNNGEIAQTVSVPQPYSTRRTFQHSQPNDEGFNWDWQVRESFNNIVSKHNLPKI
jgi:hypothetical protein